MAIMQPTVIARALVAKVRGVVRHWSADILVRHIRSLQGRTALPSQLGRNHLCLRRRYCGASMMGDEDRHLLGWGCSYVGLDRTVGS